MKQLDEVDQDEAIARAKKKIDELLDTSALGRGDLAAADSKPEHIIDDSRH